MITSFVFIDSRVADIDSLLDDMPAGAEVVIINGAANGLDQIVASLQGRSGIDAIHIISHGSSGSLSLGDSVIDSDALSAHAIQLETIGQSLTATGDILLYGCNVAAGDVGVQFIGSFAQATGADVGASTDLTGAVVLGGDWVLEATTGIIEEKALLDQNLRMDYSGLLSVVHASAYDIRQASLLSAFAYESSDQLLTYLNSTNWQPLGSDPVPFGPYEGDELPAPHDLPFLSTWDSYFGDGVSDSNFLFDNGNVQAFAARNLVDGSLIISFRGSTKHLTDADLLQDLFHGKSSFRPEYDQFYFFIESIDRYVADNQIEKVLVTGHSLGGVMAEWFMVDHINTTQTEYLGVTFGSPGDATLASSKGDSRLINFGHTEDPVFNSAENWVMRSNDVAIDLSYVSGYVMADWGLLQMGMGDTSIHGIYTYVASVKPIIESSLFDLFISSPSKYHVLMGSENSDVYLLGTSGGMDFIIGQGGNDKMFGVSGDDLLDGGAGNDSLDGGDGSGDVAIFSGNSNDYSITHGSDSLTISGPDGLDVLSNIEILEFGGGVIVRVDSLPGPPATTTTIALDPVTADQTVMQVSKYQSAAADSSGTDTFVFDPAFFNLGSSVGYGTGKTLEFLKNYVTVSSAGISAIKFTASDLFIQVTGFELFKVKGWDTVTLAQVNGLIDGTLLADDYGAVTVLTSSPVTSSEVISGTIGSSADVDRFSVQLTGGHKYAFNGSAWKSSLDPFLTLHSNDGTLVAANNNVGAGVSNANLVFTPAISGTYYLDIFGFGFTKGQYLIAHSDISGSSIAETLAATSQPADPVSPGGWSWWGTSGADAYSWTSSGPALLRGDDGNDSITGGNGSGNHDVIWGDGGDDTLRGQGGPNVILGGSGNDRIQGGPSNDELHGETGDDTIYSYAGDDYLHGYSGQDFLSAGDGDDYVKGGSENDDISGGGGNDELYGDEGNDEVNGGDGNDIVKGGIGDDYVDGDGGDDLVEGEAGNDTLVGDDGNDVLRGGAGNDELRGDRGNNVLDGGEGDDWADYSQLGSFSGVAVNLFDEKAVTFKDLTGDATFDLLYTADDRYDKLISIENVRGGPRNDRIDGNHSNNIISAGQGDDLVRGHNGFDSIVGGSGNDILWGDEGDDTVAGGPGNDEVRGGLGSDTLYGDDGDDELRGEQDNDSIDGGVGLDVAFFWGEREDFSVALNLDGSYTVADIRAINQEGTDTVRNVEIFRFFSGDVGVAQILSSVPLAVNDIAAISEDDIALVDVLTNDHDDDGNALTLVDLTSPIDGPNTYIASGRIVIDPGHAFDYLNPGDALDFLVSYSATDGTGWRNSATLAITINGAAERFDGSPDADVLTGTNFVDVLVGEAGADTLTGTPGEDTLDGGTGFDTVVYTSTTRGIVVNLAVLQDHATGPEIDTDQIFNVENVVGGDGNDRITGDAMDNRIEGGRGQDAVDGGGGNDSIHGGDGNDLLNGGRGADQMEGGDGNDIYVVDHRVDQVIEVADGGIDSVSAKVGHVLADNVENLFLTGSVTVRNGGFFSRKTTTIDLSIDGTGNESDNLLRGNRGSNELDGMGGNDTLLGGAGADALRGGTGADRLVGGAGADVFVFAAGDGGASLAAADILYDFEDGIDRIALAGGLDFANLTITQGDGTDTAAGNTVIGTSSGEYLAVLLNTSTGVITGLDFQMLGV